MNYKEEIEKFQTAFNAMPIYGKLLIVGQFLISFMSLASLSQNIIEFYGFLAEGVNFYRTITQFLFQHFISNFGLIQSQLDAILLLSIITTTLIIYQVKNDPLFIIFDISYWFIISCEIIKSPSERAFYPVIATILVVACTALLPLMFFKLRANRGAMVYHRASISLILIFFSICVVAAISDALAKILAQ